MDVDATSVVIFFNRGLDLFCRAGIILYGDYSDYTIHGVVDYTIRCETDP